MKKVDVNGRITSRVPFVLGPLEPIINNTKKLLGE